MGNRELKKSKQTRYFEPVPSSEDLGEKVRDLFPLAPFVVSGGKNTERYYFLHVNALSSKYKFNVRPEYFGDESAYTEVFPKRIADILSKNEDAKVFCVFDMDVVIRDGLQEKHDVFVSSLSSEIKSGQVVLCESMPSFEFWLLLHFVDFHGLLRNYQEVADILALHIKPYFADADKRLKKLLKSEKFLQDSAWVERLLAEGRIEEAVKRSKVCLDEEKHERGRYSYTMVYKAFEDCVS